MGRKKGGNFFLNTLPDEKIIVAAVQDPVTGSEETFVQDQGEDFFTGPQSCKRKNYRKKKKE